MSLLAALASCFLVLLVFVKLLQELVSYRTKAKDLSWIPGPPAIPLLGNFQLLGLSMPELFNFKRNNFKENGSIYKVWMFTEPKVFIRGADMVKPFLIDNVNLQKGDMYQEGLMSLGPGLINSHGDRWFQMRKMLTPSFHMGRLDTVPSEILPQLEELLARLDRHADTGVPFRAAPALQSYGMCTTLNAFVGFDEDTINRLKHLQEGYVHSVELATEIAIKKAFLPLARNKVFFRLSSLYEPLKIALSTITNYVNKLIEEREEMDEKLDPTTQNKKINIFYDNLIMNLKKGLINERTLFEEVNQIIFAAFDTTAVSLEFTLFHLGNNRKVQERLREEIDELADKALSEGFKYKDLNKLEYLDRVLKESLRLTPAGDVISRRLVTPVKMKGGVIPAGTEVVMDIFNTHYDPEVWPQPQLFDPDRFLPDATASRDPFSYIPFSAGARNCIGSKMAVINLKMGIIAILSKFRVESTSQLSDLSFFSSQILRCEGGLDVKLFRRNDKSK